MGIITKNFVTKNFVTKFSPIPISSGGTTRIHFADGAQTAQQKTSYLRYYSEIGWLKAAISTIAQAVAQSEWRLYRKVKDGDREEITGAHPLKDLLNRPNPFQSGHDFLELHQTFIELIGEAYQIKQTDKGSKELWLVPPQYMKVLSDPIRYVGGYEYERAEDKRIFKPEDVIAFLEPNPLDPFVGSGRTQAAGIDIENESFMSQYNRNFFYWGAEAGTIITYPIEANITPDELNRLAEQWNAGHRSYGRAHRSAILTQGATIEREGMTQRDMQFPLLAKHNRDKILGVFGLSYALLGGTESVNRANAEAQLLNFARWVLTPRLIKIREKWNMFLVPDYGDDLELDFDNPVPEDTQAQALVIDGHVKTGVYSLEEARQLLDMGELNKDDHFLIQNSFQIMTGGQILSGESPAPPVPFGGRSIKKKSLFDSVEKKTEYWRAYVKQAESYEPHAVEVLQKMYASQQREALENLRDAVDRHHKLIDVRKAKKTYAEAMTPVLTPVILGAAKNSLELVTPKNPHKAEPEPLPKPIIPLILNEKALAWLKTRIGWAAEQTCEETASQLADALAEGFELGEAIPKIADRIKQVFTEASDVRAKRIARTEILQASNEGNRQGFKEFGIEQEEWLTSRDERVCDICDPMDGEVFPIDDFPTPPASTHPSCRCVGLPIVE